MTRLLLCLFQLPSLAGCRPWAGERLRGETGWPHWPRKQGAVEALWVGCWRLRVSEFRGLEHTTKSPDASCRDGLKKDISASWRWELPQLHFRTVDVCRRQGWQSLLTFSWEEVGADLCSADSLYPVRAADLVIVWWNDDLLTFFILFGMLPELGRLLNVGPWPCGCWSACSWLWKFRLVKTRKGLRWLPHLQQMCC